MSLGDAAVHQIWKELNALRAKMDRLEERLDVEAARIRARLAEEANRRGLR